MVGRQEFYRRRAKNAQRPFPGDKPKPLDDSVWFSRGMEAARDLDYQTNGEFGKVGFASLMGVSEDEGERRLRVLTRAGFLHMGVERSPSGSFIRYTWRLRDANLPRPTEITER